MATNTGDGVAISPITKQDVRTTGHAQHTRSTVGIEARGLLTVKEAAAWLAISPATCYRLMERGCLPSVKIGAARRVRATDLQSLIAKER